MPTQDDQPEFNSGVYDETMAPGESSDEVVSQELGSYQLSRIIGKGAMGVVYEAVDSKLGRTVAIKTLPLEFAQDSHRVSRFSREASLLASLSHPHIATVFSHEEFDGKHCLVMEYVEGQGLDELIQSSSLTTNETIRFATQVASALESAHNHGVIHRDLKPANIRITGGSNVKVLDFGLAKNVRVGDSESSIDEVAKTAAGQILGTPAYMSPEQARGRVVDKRTDIWALGCIIFEMLTGERAYGGDNLSDTLVNILEREPNWNAIPSDTPPAILRLLERCLQKDVELRLTDAGLVRLDLEEISIGGGASSISTSRLSTLAKPNSFRWIGWITALIAAVMLGMFFGGSNSPSNENVQEQDFTRPTFLSLHLEQPAVLTAGSSIRLVSHVAISPDGRQIATSAGDVDSPLILRSLDGYDTIVVEGSEGARGPFFSPDGDRIGFVKDSIIYVMSADGTGMTMLTDVTADTCATWNSDGWIYYSNSFGAVFWRIPDTGGDRELLGKRWVGEYRSPSCLPDGRLLFTRQHSSIHEDYSNAYVYDPKTKEELLIGRIGCQLRYVNTGHIVYSRGGDLNAIRFDLDASEVIGKPNTIVANVVSTGVFGNAQFDVTSSGTLVYLPGPRLDYGQVSIVSRDGTVTPLENFPLGSFSHFEISPDERYLAISIVAERDDIWIYDFKQKTNKRLTVKGVNVAPSWSDDGKSLYYSSLRDLDGIAAVFKTTLTGSEEEKIIELPDWGIMSEPNKDEDFFVFTADSNIYTLDLKTNDGVSEPFDFGGWDWNPAISPDQRRMIFGSDVTGRNEVYIAPFPFDATGIRQLSTAGGTEGIWSADGKKVWYVMGDTFYSVSIAEELDFEIPNAVKEFSIDHIEIPGVRYRPIGKEGDMVMVMPLSSREPIDRLHLIQNSTAGVK